jgi:phosphoribosylanthranilate isomerase
MLIKVCGIADPEFLQQIDDMNINLIGFIFYPLSKRYMEGKLTAEQIHAIPKSIKKVGVFVNEEIKNILHTTKRYALDFVQLHGDEDVSFVKNLSGEIPVIKAFRVDENFDFDETLHFENACYYFLFDTKDSLFGGTGKKFDWRLLEKYKGKTSFLLSGGISPDDVARIKQISHPKCAGIDINSGFETEPGVKNIDQIKNFINQII